MPTSLRCLSLLPFLLLPLPRASAQQTPAIEHASLLNAFEVYHQSRQLGFGTAYGAFFPADAIDDGASGGPAQLTELVLRDAAGSELYRCPLYVGARHSVFTTVRAGGTPVTYEFQQAGAYLGTIEVGGRRIAELPFELELRGTGDPFNPLQMAFADGDWDQLAYLALPRKSEASRTPELRFWARGGVFNEDGQDHKIRLEVRQAGHTIYQAGTAIVSNIESSSSWEQQSLALKYPLAAGGGPVPLSELCKQDGGYQAILFRNEQPWRLFQFHVAGGKLVPHARQKFGYQPHADFLLARNPAAQEPNSEDLIWMTRASEAELAAASSATAAAVEGPSAAAREAWAATTTSAPAREAALHLSGLAVRMDAGLAVGDDVIAFATGSIKGVSWMKAGEDVEHTLPGGQDFHSKHFFVCGKKIVLLRGAQVVVFDTETEVLHEIPQEEIYVWRSFLDSYKGNAIAANGFLVAVLNDPKYVTDRVTPKVIDVSGSEPRVIALQNIEVPVRDLESIAVDAGTGRVVMASYRQKSFFVAQVALGAPFQAIDLSSIDGVGRESSSLLAGGWLAYQDASGSQPKLRLIELETKRTQTLPSLGKAYRCYDLSAERLAFATTQNRGSEYAVALGVPGGAVALPTGAGDPLPETGANVGMGSSIAIAGGLTFIAGLGSGGLGSGEYLQVSDGESWRVLVGADGKPLPASDVVSSGRLVAFKTGSRNDTTVGYLTLGAQSGLAELPLQ